LVSCKINRRVSIKPNRKTQLQHEMPEFVPYAASIVEKNFHEANKFKGLVSSMIGRKTTKEILALSKTPVVLETTKAFLEHLCFADVIDEDFKHGKVDNSAVLLFVRAFKLAHFDESLALNQSQNARTFAALARTMMLRFEEVRAGYLARRLTSSRGFIAAAKEFFAFARAFQAEEQEFMTKKLHQMLMIHHLSQTPETMAEVREMRSLLAALGGNEAVARLDRSKVQMTEVLASLGRWPLGPAIRFDLHGDRLVVHAFEEASSSDEEEADESDVIPTAEVVTPSAPAA
jgi:hypothetical protein